MNEVQVGNNEYGKGIFCEETYSGLGSDRTCAVSGGACYNIETTPGTGGGGSDPGDGGGIRNDTGGCSAEYYTC